MAIASGVPVPPCYVLEGEASINAFAAGYQAEDAIVAVTRGALDQLTRDELQGVMAHEFSHVLNGDMRLNLRLVAVVAGLMGIALIGRTIINAATHLRSSKDSAQARLALWSIGGVLGDRGVSRGSLWSPHSSGGESPAGASRRRLSCSVYP